MNTMYTLIPQEDVVNVIRHFFRINAGDESTSELILCIGVELLDISIDNMMELM